MDIHDNELIHQDLHIGSISKFNIKVPQLIVHLIKRCLDANPLNRPTAKEVNDILYSWSMSSDIELKRQIKEAEEINNLTTNSIIHPALSYETHSEAIYTSR